MNEEQRTSTPQSAQLIEEARKLEKQLAISNSLSRKFLSALIYGCGTVIGATLLIAIMLSILSMVANYGILPDFNEWLIETIRR